MTYSTCPHCGNLCAKDTDRCEDCGEGLYGGRQRWFCSFCGAITRGRPGADGLTRCVAHKDLVDALPVDPLQSIPTMAAQLREESSPRKGSVI